MKTKISSICMAFVMLLATSAFNSIEHGSSAIITWGKLEHDFGKITKGKFYDTEFSFKNTGDKPLMILSVIGSCGCTVTDYTRGEILPGKSGEVTAKYNATRLGSFQKTVTVTASVDGHPIILKLKGEVVEGC